jgi:hypothetical protein
MTASNSTETTAPTPTPVTVDSGDDDLNHWRCCEDRVTLCGAPLGEGEDVPPEKVNCVVCIDLQDLPCRPGCDWTKESWS